MKALRARRWVNPRERVLSPLRGSLPYAFGPTARAMGPNAYGKEPRRGERTLSRGFTHRRARRAFLRPYGAGASLGRSHRAYALGYFLVPLTGLRTAHAQDWPDAKNSASRRRRGLKT